MRVTLDTRGDSIVAVQHDPGLLIQSAADATDVLGATAFAYGVRKLVLRIDNFSPDFFRLRTGLAGEVLQKFTNYRVAIAIVGGFAPLVKASPSLRDFVTESNRGRHVFFAETLDEALEWLHGVT
jgi:hypothetical protein